MEDLFKMLTAFMAQMTALFKRVEVLEERTLDEVPSLEAFKVLEERIDAFHDEVCERLVYEALDRRLDGDLEGLKAEIEEERLRDLDLRFSEFRESIDDRLKEDCWQGLCDRLDAIENTYIHESEIAAPLQELKVEIVNEIESMVRALESPPISNHADLKTDDQKILSALMSIELFFNMTSFVDEHEGCAFGDYINHKDILETDYPLDISEPREGEPLLEEARKAFEIIKAHLIK